MYYRAYGNVIVCLLIVGNRLFTDALNPSRRVKIDALDRMKHLDLIWKIREEIDECDITKEEMCGNICLMCDGVGELPCRFCRGTGFLMLGHELIGTLNDCPVCRGGGYEECKECMGAGNVAQWREPNK